MLRKFFNFLLFLLFLIVFAEISGHLLYRFTKGTWVWEVPKEHDIFNVRAFTELVNDERIITNRKDFSCEVSRNRVYLHAPRDEKDIKWTVSTDPNGFRKGINEYYIDKENIVFIGDSVPFGWGIDGKDSVPSQFYTLLNTDQPGEYGVINAAIPSYSLYQAINRYKYEIDGKFPVKIVILQIFDPAPQFAIWGKKWTKDICWTSKDTLVSSKEVAKETLKRTCPVMTLLHRYSFLDHLVYCVKVRLLPQGSMPALLDLDDKEAFDNFEKENLSILEDFYGLLRKKNIALVILPVNPTVPLSGYSGDKLALLDDRNKKIVVSINKLNDILKKFAASHDDVYFFDVVSFFDKTGRDGMFVDDQCHLSPNGAGKQAGFIMEELSKNGLLR